eukprot:355423-Pelagomonas_calceolata.AAC.2
MFPYAQAGHCTKGRATKSASPQRCKDVASRTPDACTTPCALLTLPPIPHGFSAGCLAPQFVVPPLKGFCAGVEAEFWRPGPSKGRHRA